jgi:hypothetical protein
MADLRTIDINDTVDEDEFDKFKDSLNTDTIDKFISIYNEMEEKYNMGPDSVLTVFSIPLPILYIVTAQNEAPIVTDLNKKVDFLLSKGAALNSTQVLEFGIGDLGYFVYIEDGNALISAVFGRSPLGVKVLLDKKINMNDQSTQGKNAFEYAVELYNLSLYDALNNIHSLIQSIGVMNVFLNHPEVRRQLGDVEFNRIKSRMDRPINDAIQHVIQEIQKTTGLDEYWNMEGDKSRSEILQLLKVYLEIPKISNKNVRQQVSRRRFKPIKEKALPFLPLSEIRKFLNHGPRPQRFTVPAQPKGPGAAPVVTPAVLGQPMRYNVALALQHPNQWALPNKVANTRKRKSRRNKKTRRSRRA